MGLLEPLFGCNRAHEAPAADIHCPHGTLTPRAGTRRRI